jgi:hypothetical protein
MNKLVFQIIMFVMLLTTLNSCKDNNSPSNQNNPNGDLKSGGTLKITTSNGTIKTITNFKPKYVSNEGDYFYSDRYKDIYESIDSYDTNKFIITGYYTNGGLVDIRFNTAVVLGIETGVVYTYPSAQPLKISFEDGISSDYSNVKKTTIRFSSWIYSKRITGIIINYDGNGIELAKGEFDFIPFQ